ncbi:MFS transporter [Deinococcus aquiradiocola]|uniref:MFS transporter n=1 Tax=Deinococcus aquiradiocola TaxID=393059 RepID=A0A917UTG9_9DEIO|nr:MFS transporter [Deinococcus aquiradiocola]GGJ84276.1 MFS transporter [Deinococcus aquiradiocola]
MLKRLQASLPWGPGRNGLMLRALLLLGLCELVRTGLYVGFLPQQLAAEKLPLTAAGLAWTVHYGADTLCRSPGGHLVERFGLRPVLAVGALVSVLTVFAMPFAPTTLALVALAALHGAAISPLWPAVMTLSSVLAPEDAQPRAVSLVSVAAGPFTGIGFLGIGALASVHFADSNSASRLHDIGGWPLAVLLAVQGLAFLLSFTLKAGPLRPDTPRRAAAPVSLRRTLAFLIPAALVQTLALSLLGPVITPFTEHMGLGQWGLGGLLVAGAGTAYALLGVTGRLTTRYGARPMLTLGLLLAAAGLALMATMPPLWMYFVLAAVLGVGYACLLPGWGGLVAGLLPQEGRAASWGVVMTAENVGMASGPLLGTFAWDRLGMSAPFLVGAGLFVLTASVYLWPRRAAAPE